MKSNTNWKDKSKGVYEIRNILNNDIYIGSTINTFYNRYRNHLSNLKKGNHHSQILQRSVDKYGIENFVFTQLFVCINDSCIIQLEDYLIKTLYPKYNVCKEVLHGGKPNLGKKLRKDWKEKIQIASCKYKHDTATLKRVTANNKQNAVSWKLTKGSEVLTFKSGVKLAKYFNVDASYIPKAYLRNKNNMYRGYTITKLSSQKKRIRLSKDSKSWIFNSYYDCDKFLDMWRGFTSTHVTRGSKSIKGYIIQLS